MTIGWSNLTVFHQAVAAHHEAVAQVAAECLGAAGLAEQPRRTDAVVALGLFGEQRLPEITLGTCLCLGATRSKAHAATGWWWIFISPVDPLQGAVGRSGLQQGAIH